MSKIICASYWGAQADYLGNGWTDYPTFWTDASGRWYMAVVSNDGDTASSIPNLPQVDVGQPCPDPMPVGSNSSGLAKTAPGVVLMSYGDYQMLTASSQITSELQNGWNYALVAVIAVAYLVGVFFGRAMARSAMGKGS